MPSVKEHLHGFMQDLYLKPFGDKVIGDTYKIGMPRLPASSGEDQTALGTVAIMSLASIRNSADEMALASSQAQAIARNSKIASVRAYEALRSYEDIWAKENPVEDLGIWTSPNGQSQRLRREDDEGGSPGASAFLATSHTWTTGNSHRNAHLAHGSSFLSTSSDPSFPTSFKAKKKKKAKKDDSGGAAAGGPGDDEDDEEEIDVNNAFYLKQDMRRAFANTRKVAIDAAQMAESITKKYHEVQNAARATAEALNLPGAPLPPPIPPVFLKPPRRPRDLSPFWLDVPYATGTGADPYSVHDLKPRKSASADLEGVPGFNPFEGTVPYSNAGLRGFYGSVGHDGKVPDGLDYGGEGDQPGDGDQKSGLGYVDQSELDGNHTKLEGVGEA